MSKFRLIDAVLNENIKEVKKLLNDKSVLSIQL